ncbi:5688_t:CDS:2, partial [Dentiscutata erythropus]
SILLEIVSLLNYASRQKPQSISEFFEILFENNWCNMLNSLKNLNSLKISNSFSNLPDLPNFIKLLYSPIPTKSLQLSALLPGNNLSPLLLISASIINSNSINFC